MRDRRVYFLRRADGTGPIKIGCSATPEGRRRQLSYDMKLNLALLVAVPGTLEMEGELHRQFAPYRVAPQVTWNRHYPLPGAKEWFEAVPELLTIIAGAQQTGDLPAFGEPFRNSTIIRRRFAGERLQSIATDFGITRERVRQIVAEHVYGSRKAAA